MNWTFYREVREGDRVWRSYRADATLGYLYKEVIAYVDAASGLVKAASEAVSFVAQPDAALTWVKEQDTTTGERREELYSATVAGGKMYLSITSYVDVPTHLIKAVSATMELVSTTDVGGVESVNGASGVVVLDTDDIAEGATNLYFNGKDTDDLPEGATNLYFNGKDTDDLPEGATNEYYTDAKADARVDAAILFFDSAPSLGGLATETLAVTGLLATDEILSVSQKTPGASGTALTGWANQADNALDLTWTADPGAGAVARVAVKRIP